MAVCSGPSLRFLKEALVLDIFSGEEFWAIKGCGAFSDGRKLSTSNTGELAKAVISIDQSRVPKGSAGWVVSLIESVDATRQLGSAALELCLLASGALDAYVDLRERIRPTDVAAGLLIALEAGARAWLRGTLKPDGALDPGERLRILVSNPALFEPLLSMLKPYLSSGLEFGAGVERGD